MITTKNIPNIMYDKTKLVRLGFMFTQFKAYCFESVLRDTTVVRSSVREEFLVGE